MLKDSVVVGCPRGRELEHFEKSRTLGEQLFFFGGGGVSPKGACRIIHLVLRG